MSRLRVQVVAAITAIIGFVLPIVYGGKNSPANALRVYSFSVSAVIVLFFLYDRFVFAGIAPRTSVSPSMIRTISAATSGVAV